MKTNYNYSPHLIPITLSRSLHLPPSTNCTTQVSIPVSSISSPFIPNKHFAQNNTLHVPNKLLQFYNYSSPLTLSNKSSYPQYITKGHCMGFVYARPAQQQNRHSLNPMSTLSGAIKSFGETPDSTSSNKDIPNDSHLNNPISCSTSSPIHPLVDKNLHELARKLQSKQHHNSLLSLLCRFYQIFDTTKHNVANTSINHVIHTIPHTPPASKRYPQPDKEEAMYTIIQEFCKQV